MSVIPGYYINDEPEVRCLSARFRPVGVDYAALVATNRTDDGKAKNRPIKLVEQ